MDFIERYLADGVVVVFFLCFAVGYGRRGIYKSLAGVIVTAAAVLGALLAAYLLSGAVTEWIYPRVAERFAGKVDLGGVRAVSLGGITEQLQELLPEDFLNLIRKLGMQIGAFVSAAAGDSAIVADAQRTAADAVSAMLLEATESVVRIVLFLLSLFVLRLMLTGVKQTLGLVIRLPMVRWLDVLGGAVLGLVVCAVILYAALWVCDLFRVEDVVSLAEQSRILTEILNLQSGTPPSLLS